jgi:hypothetical protein
MVITRLETPVYIDLSTSYVEDQQSIHLASLALALP